MISASKEFKEKLKRDRVPLANYADITLSDGTVLHLEPKDFMIGGCQIEDKTTDGKFGVGYCIGKTLSVRLENKDERFSRYDFYMSIIILYVGMLMDDGTIEKIRKGVYYATIPSTKGNIIEISAVDGIYRLDKDYSSSRISYPATLHEILSGACLDCGIPIGFRQFENMSFVVQEKPGKATYRQVVSWACQIAGYNAHIDNNGYMQLIWYNSTLLDRYNYSGGGFKVYPHDTVVDGGNFTDYNSGTIITGGLFTDERPEHIFLIKSLDVHTDDVQITGVRVVGEDEKTEVFGEEGYLIEVKGNPFVNGKEREVANYLGRRMVGMVFRPFTAQILQNPLYEPFEVVMVSDRKGNVYNSIINSVSYKIGGYTQIACKAEDPVRNGSEYFSEAAAAVVEARRNTEKQISTYDKAVQQMNQIAMNAMGFHTTYEEQADGSRIVYLHDKPELEESKTVYKQTIDGFFISTDGGKSYTAGFDKNGNVIVNVLYAIGIVCDWIRGGTLTLGGDNNINGIAVILDENGNKKASLEDVGILLYGNRKEIGHIGTANLVGSVVTGLSFNLENSASYASWAYRETSNASGYKQKMFLSLRSDTGVSQGLYLYTDLYMNSYEIHGASDERLKKNIKESEINALATINSIETYSYDWIESGKHEKVGFIAQQMETVVEELVHVEEKTNAYSINEIGLIPYLVKAVQELSKEVMELKEEIALMNGKKVYKSRTKSASNKWEPTLYSDIEKKNYVEMLKNILNTGG